MVTLERMKIDYGADIHWSTSVDVMMALLQLNDRVRCRCFAWTHCGIVTLEQTNIDCGWAFSHGAMLAWRKQGRLKERFKAEDGEQGVRAREGLQYKKVCVCTC
jgi:hypothetical protein